MAKVTSPAEDPKDAIRTAMEEFTVKLCNLYDLFHLNEETPRDPAPTKKQKPAPVEVEPEADEVSEDAIRARCGDIVASSKDGSGKDKCIAVVKKIGGGKIADLNTPELRAKAMTALDKLYNELSVM